jgi:hypothetical protein
MTIKLGSYSAIWIVAALAALSSCQPDGRISERSERLVAKSSLQMFSECIQRLREDGYKDVASIEQLFVRGQDENVSISEFYSRGSQWYLMDNSGTKCDYVVYRSKEGDPKAVLIATPRAVQLAYGKTGYLALTFDLSIVEMDPIQFHEQILKQTGPLDWKN